MGGWVGGWGGGGWRAWTHHVVEVVVVGGVTVSVAS